jgi:hypothetical protein
MASAAAEALLENSRQGEKLYFDKKNKKNRSFVRFSFKHLKYT